MANEDVTQEARLLRLAEAKGVLRTRDLQEHAIPRVYLRRLVERGLLFQSGRGLYLPADADLSEHHSLAVACRRVPSGVICLLSALSFHGIGSQLPSQVWIAIAKGVWRPQVDYPRLRIVHMSGAPMTTAVDEHVVEGVPVHVFSPAKTVADCFRFRNRIGVDVAIEALRVYHRERRGTMDDLMACARADRVDKVMLPYLESLA